MILSNDDIRTINYIHPNFFDDFAREINNVEFKDDVDSDDSKLFIAPQLLRFISSDSEITGYYVERYMTYTKVYEYNNGAVAKPEIITDVFSIQNLFNNFSIYNDKQQKIIDNYAVYIKNIIGNSDKE